MTATFILFPQEFPVLPKFIPEDQVFVFNFWFDNTMQQGMYFRNELYCRIGEFPVDQRVYVYRAGCKLSRRRMSVVLTNALDHCSLWVDLRTPLVRELLSGRLKVDLESQELLVEVSAPSI